MHGYAKIKSQLMFSCLKKKKTGYFCFGLGYLASGRSALLTTRKTSAALERMALYLVGSHANTAEISCCRTCVMRTA